VTVLYAHHCAAHAPAAFVTVVLLLLLLAGLRCCDASEEVCVAFSNALVRISSLDLRSQVGPVAGSAIKVHDSPACITNTGKHYALRHVAEPVLCVAGCEIYLDCPSLLAAGEQIEVYRGPP